MLRARWLPVAIYYALILANEVAHVTVGSLPATPFLVAGPFVALGLWHVWDIPRPEPRGFEVKPLDTPRD
jgi:hypothetical protein